MQAVYSTGPMACVVAAGGQRNYMNLGLEEFPGQVASSRKKQIQMVKKVFDLLKPSPATTIADFGCGQGGALSLLLAMYDVQKVFGYNIDEMQLSVAGKLLQEEISANRCELVTANLDEELPIAPKVDGIYSIEVLTHLRNKSRFFFNARNLLNDNGVFVVAYFALPRPFDDYHEDDRQYMFRMAEYFQERPGDILTHRQYLQLAEDAGFSQILSLNLSDQVFPHRHYEMLRVLSGLKSSNPLRRSLSKAYWAFWEGANLPFLREYLEKAVAKNQSRLYEYYISVWKVDK